MSAIFSPCRTWRYRLERRWGDGTTAAFILLNPSTADERLDDPTIRRCIGYARTWGYGGLIVGNLFALRSTDPKALYAAEDPVGPDNNAALRQIVRDAAITVCGWGSHGRHRCRGNEVVRMLYQSRPYCLGMTKHGLPRHPLYLRKNLQPMLLLGPVHGGGNA